MKLSKFDQESQLDAIILSVFHDDPTASISNICQRFHIRRELVEKLYQTWLNDKDLHYEGLVSKIHHRTRGPEQSHVALRYTKKVWKSAGLHAKHEIMDVLMSSHKPGSRVRLDSVIKLIANLQLRDYETTYRLDKKSL
jgi:hypothetical protein